MRILGVDPGLKATGYGVIDLDAGARVRVLEAGTIEPDPKAAFAQRIARVHQHIGGLLASTKPDVVVLEKLYAHYKHPTTACVLGHVRGVICLGAAQHKVALVEYSVKRVRQALVGNGNATKPQVQAFVKRLLKIEGAEMPLDASDALALALGHAHMLKFKLF
ncbi:MAG: crossover junction endodeoxyribonuclease RuvC [Candidatus Omnitrophica bacterium]|nr:crossover junction endodeoxyribonuclease RuvC [Candidatus Omnitrophota bacterium]